MAKIIEPISDEELKRITAPNLRVEYKKLADKYKQIINGELVKCNCCGEWKNANSFYHSDKSVDGIEHYGCKECVLDQCTDYDKKTKIRSDNRNKTIATFKKLDWYFNEQIYNDQLNKLAEGTGEKIRSTAVQQWIVISRSLNDYSKLSFADSEFLDDDTENNTEENTKIIQKTLKSARKRFGNYPNEDLMFLENEYQDWVTRYECNTKAQETIFERLAFKKWEINKATKAGQNTKDLDRTYTELLSSINILPRQNVCNAATDSLTFGQLIERWEQERPVPTPSEEFQDCDNIGKYLRVFFSGWLAKAVGLKNALSQECEEYIQQYTVTKPEYQEEGSSGDIYETLFGNDGE
jgi:hypothetical protein